MTRGGKIQKRETRSTKSGQANQQKNEYENGAEKKIEPGHSAEGPRDPGLSCPPPQ
jgi:hypothetical protein